MIIKMFFDSHNKMNLIKEKNNQFHIIFI